MRIGAGALRSRAARRGRGVAAVELALLLPLLVTVMLGAVDFGRFAFAHVAVTNAARAGADYGSRNPVTTITQANWEAQVRSKVVAEMQPVMDADDGFGPADLRVTVARTVESGSLWRVRVEASYPFQMIVRWPGLPYRLDLRRAVVMRGIR